MTQFSFEFDPPKPTEPPAAAPVVAPLVLNLEQMAQLLEQHADYRVLRRLVPCVDYGPHPGNPGVGLRVLVLDTETTGLSHASDKIIELAMLLVQVDVATGQPFGPVETFEGFEDPGMPIPEVAKQVTGISDDMVRGQRLDDAQVQALIDRADLVVAHNAGFDRPFVEARFPGFAHKAWACSFADIDWKALGADSSKLGALAQDQGWFYDAHRALVDCHALLQVLGHRVGDGGGDGEVNGLQRLMTAAEVLMQRYLDQPAAEADKGREAFAKQQCAETHCAQRVKRDKGARASGTDLLYPAVVPDIGDCRTDGAEVQEAQQLPQRDAGKQ